MVVDVVGPVLADEDRERLRHPAAGAVILFTRNYESPEQLQNLCEDIARLREPELAICVDHEGGRVQRFRVGFTRVPAMGTLGKLYLEDRRRALADASKWGRVIGRELSGFGIDLSFAPVLDRDTGNSKVIGDRAFSGDIKTIVALARAFIRGLAGAGHAATGKHFPGHGAVVADSHEELPVDRRSWSDLEATELAPFRELIEDGIPSLMLAHVKYSAVDETPASLSRYWIQTVLRDRLKYDGALVCDDLSMGGAAGIGSMTERARLALAAGCDLLLVCNDRPATLELLANLQPAPRVEASRRLRRLYRKASVTAKPKKKRRVK